MRLASASVQMLESLVFQSSAAQRAAAHMATGSPIRTTVLEFIAFPDAMQGQGVTVGLTLGGRSTRLQTSARRGFKPQLQTITYQSSVERSSFPRLRWPLLPPNRK